MKNRLFLLFFLLISLENFSQSVYSPNNDTVFNQTFKNGKKFGFWKKKYENGNTRYIGQFLNDNPIGTFKYYNINGRLESIVVHKKDTSFVTVYYTDNGEIKNQFTYINKMKFGTGYFYYPDCTIRAIGHYENGLKHGKFETFYKNGNLMETKFYENDKLIDTIKQYYENGYISKVKVYNKNGIEDGITNVYDSKGMPLYSGVYANGIKNGEWVTFKNGKEWLKLNFINGVSKEEKDIEVEIGYDDKISKFFILGLPDMIEIKRLVDLMEISGEKVHNMNVDYSKKVFNTHYKGISVYNKLNTPILPKKLYVLGENVIVENSNKEIIYLFDIDKEFEKFLVSVGRNNRVPENVLTLIGYPKKYEETGTYGNEWGN